MADSCCILALIESHMLFFGVSLLVVILLLFVGFGVGYWLSLRPESTSPYTGTPLRRGSDLSYYNTENVLRYLYNMHQYDNRMFDVKAAALCRDTGRLFPDALTWYDKIQVDWSFLQKHHPGQWVSWGSLSDFQKESIRAAHHSLEGYQTEFSSPTPSPRLIEKQYAWAKPGPLYVDLESKKLMGWKCVPRTSLEVLIVQKPKGIFEVPKT